MNVTEKIKTIRQDKGFSHEAMAMNLGISQTAYTKLERNETKLSIDRLYKIAEILEVSIFELLDEEKSVQQNIHNNTNVTAIGNQKIENLYQENKEITQDLLKTKDLLIEKLQEENTMLKKKVREEN